MSAEVRKRRPLKYFLLTIDMKQRDQSERSLWLRKGSLCLEQDGGPSLGDHLWVQVLDVGSSLKLEKRFLLEVTSDLGSLLEPVDPDQRLKLIDNPAMLTHLATLPEGSPLWVTLGEDDLAEAVLRFIGPVSPNTSAVYFGVQLKGAAKGRGLSDGSYNGRQLFTCPDFCALFVPVSLIQKRQWSRSPRHSSEGNHDQNRIRGDSNHDQDRARARSRRTNGDHNGGHHSNGHHEKPSRRILVHKPTAPPPLRSSPSPGSLQPGQRVHVPVEDTLRPGEVRWCGVLPGRANGAVYVGVQLDDPVGDWNGSFNDHQLCTFPSPKYGTLVSIKQVSAVSEPKQNRLLASTQAFKSMLKSALPPGIQKLSSSPTTFAPPPALPPVAPKTAPVTAPPPAAPKTALLPPNRPRPPPLPPPKPALKPSPPVQSVHSPTEEEEVFVKEEVHERRRLEEENQQESSSRRRRLELGLGSMVEVNNPPLFGVVRWIGRISGIQEEVAGVELEQELSAGTDGSYLGERYFHCAPNKALFVKLRKCRRDSRFPEPETPVNQVERCNSIAFAEWGSERVDDHTPPPEGEEAQQLYQGWKRGIQGHLNSCYLDATLFSLFSCCSSADWVLFWPIDAEKSSSSSEAQDLLRCEIVNPLRRFGYVCASKTMGLRRLLEAAHTDAGFTNQEKDPEEFLNTLFQLLTVEPLLQIRSMSQQPQRCHMYQLFPPSLPPPPPSSLPQDGTPHSPIALLSPPAGQMRVSSVQTLLQSSFYHSRLKFTEAPSCLLLLMPRFGKDFKMYDAILPSLNIDVTDLLDDALRQCSICESAAEWECVQCYEDTDITPGQLKQYCSTCNTQVHSHKRRSSHSPLNISVSCPSSLHGAPRCTRQRMSLFAVTCIETSHYVSFVRHGETPQDWLFFDSMADREGGENGFNVPRVKPCPEVGRYLSLSEEELGRVDPSSLRESVKRLLCDAHMCLYHSPELSLYK
ncbi:unnamed protein product [Knipowitschia caucasica]